MNKAIPILMYHQVSPLPAPNFRKYVVTPQAFTAQMRWLALAGYQTITPDTLLTYREGRAILPAKPILITFDDGFQDCVRYTAPILQKHRFSAIFYLVAGLCGATSRWLRAERNIEYPLMNWSEVRELAQAGFAFGSHTMSHPRLTNLSAQACREELSNSRALLEDKLGHSIVHLAYPFGFYNEAVRAMAAEVGYLSACSVQIGFSNSEDDVLALHRLPISGQDSLLDFICRLRTARTVGEVLPGRVGGAYRRLQKLGGRGA